MSRLLQDHDSLQSCTDCSSVCRMFDRSVPTNRRQGSSYGRLFVPKKAALKWCGVDGECLSRVNADI